MRFRRVLFVLLLLLLWAIFGDAEVAIVVWCFVGGLAAILAYWYVVEHYARLNIAGNE